MFGDPSLIDTTLESRAVSFENPTGARGAGGEAAGGRKGAPSRVIEAGERVVLADIAGPGCIRHLWCTVPPGRPERLRALVFEVYYDDATEPSVSVPLLDLFGAPLGRPRPYVSQLTTVQEGRGFNAFFPMPFRRRIRVELVNGADRPTLLYYQLDLTLGDDVPPERGLLHAGFRRENPTTLGRDMTIADGFTGPGRFLGCVVGVRTIDPARWYGEGEVKVYLDSDVDRPTICGTGLEDYIGSAWGLGAHAAPFAGAPLSDGAPDATMPEFVGFYRWHVPDPIVFHRSLRVTIQQIGMHAFPAGEDAAREAYLRTNPLAGNGWFPPARDGASMGLFERVDDYSAVAFVYCRDVQAVTPVEVAAATADLERRPWEASGRRADLGA